MQVVFRSTRRWIVPSRILTRLQDASTSWEDQRTSHAAENEREVSLRDFSLRSFATKPRGKGKGSGDASRAIASFDISNLQGLMEKAQDRLQMQLSSMRTGRASLGFLDTIRVDVYGERMPLKSAASVSVQNAQTLCVTVFDPETLPNIEKALRESALNLNPQVKGQDLLVPIPRMTEETRKEILKMVKAEAEAARVSIRNIRKDGMNAIKQEPSEDDRKRLEKQVQKLTDTFADKIDSLVHAKEQELSR
eukprot:jgi/Botrbrau1/17837/Bobra.0127s0080.1